MVLQPPSVARKALFHKVWIAILDELHFTHKSRDQVGVDSAIKSSKSSTQAFNFDAEANAALDDLQEVQ
jgi:hypothetical protein